MIKRYLVGPLSTLFLIALVAIASHFEWYTTSLAFPFIGLAIGAFYGGLRSNLVSAALITTYTIVASDYNVARSIQIITSAVTIATVSGILKRQLRERIIEAEHYRLRLLDTFNGNKARLKSAIDELDTLRDEMYGEAKKNDIWRARLNKVEAARGKLADLVLLVDSYHEMARDRRLVEQGGGRITGLKATLRH